MLLIPIVVLGVASAIPLGMEGVMGLPERLGAKYSFRTFSEEHTEQCVAEAVREALDEAAKVARDFDPASRDAQAIAAAIERLKEA